MHLRCCAFLTELKSNVPCVSFVWLQAIETSLFSIYPIVFVVQLTWIVSVMTSVMVAPYVFVVLGSVSTALSFLFLLSVLTH